MDAEAKPLITIEVVKAQSQVQVIIRVACSYIWVHSATCTSAYAHGNIRFRMFTEVSLNAKFRSVVTKTHIFMLVTVTTSFIQMKLSLPLSS